MICVAAGTVSSPSWVTVPNLRRVVFFPSVIIPSSRYSKDTGGPVDPSAISIQHGNVAIVLYKVPSPHQMPVTRQLLDSYAVRHQIYTALHGWMLLWGLSPPVKPDSQELLGIFVLTQPCLLSVKPDTSPIFWFFQPKPL